MTRSRKKTPKGGWTTAESEKEDKVAAHKNTRRATRQLLKGNPEEDPIPLKVSKLQQVWLWAKDGRQHWFGKEKEYPEWMRK